MGFFSRKSEPTWSGSSTRDQNRAAKRQARETVASAGRRARHRASLPKLGDETPRRGFFSRY